MFIFEPWKYESYYNRRIKKSSRYKMDYLLKHKIATYMWRFVFGWIVLLFILLAMSCSATKHIDKAVMKENPKFVIDYIIGKYGDSYLPKIKDTIIDTIYVVGTHVDTFKITNKIDTIILNKDNVITKVFRHYDTIWVMTDIKRDTIIRIIYKDRYMVKPLDADIKKRYWSLSMWLDIILIVIIVIGILLLLINLKR